MLTRFPKTIPVLSERSGMGRRGPLPEFFVGSFFGRGFASGLAFEAGERVFEHFGDAAVTGFRCAAIEDAEQPVNPRRNQSLLRMGFRLFPRKNSRSKPCCAHKIKHPGNDIIIAIHRTYPKTINQR